MRNQLSKVQTELATERQRREAYQKEISRLNKDTSLPQAGDKTRVKTSPIGPRRTSQTSQTSPRIKIDPVRGREEIDSTGGLMMIYTDNNEPTTTELTESTDDCKGTCNITFIYVFIYLLLGALNTNIQQQQQLLMILNQLKEKEMSLRETELQMNQLKNKYDLITHQQVITINNH